MVTMRRPPGEEAGKDSKNEGGWASPRMYFPLFFPLSFFPLSVFSPFARGSLGEGDMGALRILGPRMPVWDRIGILAKAHRCLDPSGRMWRYIKQKMTHTKRRLLKQRGAGRSYGNKQNRRLLKQRRINHAMTDENIASRRCDVSFVLK